MGRAINSPPEKSGLVELHNTYKKLTKTNLMVKSKKMTNVSPVDIVAANYGFVHNYVLKFNRQHGNFLCEDDCHDVASSIIEKILLKIDEFDPAKGPMRPWISKIAHNETVNAFLAIWKMTGVKVPFDFRCVDDEEGFFINPEVEEKEGHDFDPEARINASESILEAQRRERVRAKAISKLSIRDQQIMQMVIDHVSYADMANVLGVDVKSVGKLVFDAKKRVKMMLRQSDFLDNDFSEE